MYVSSLANKYYSHILINLKLSMNRAEFIASEDIIKKQLWEALKKNCSGKEKCPTGITPPPIRPFVKRAIIRKFVPPPPLGLALFLTTTFFGRLPLESECFGPRDLEDLGAWKLRVISRLRSEALSTGLLLYEQPLSLEVDRNLAI